MHSYQSLIRPDIQKNVKKSFDKLIESKLLTEESSDVIYLDFDEFEEINSKIKEFGGSLVHFIDPEFFERGLQEARRDWTNMSIAELEAEIKLRKRIKDETGKRYTSVPIRIPKWATSKVKEMINAGMVGKDWYNDMNSNIRQALGMPEANLFFLLLASFSPRNPVQRNFVQASRVFKGIRNDFDNPDVHDDMVDLIRSGRKNFESVLKVEVEEAREGNPSRFDLFNKLVGGMTWPSNMHKILTIYVDNNESIPLNAVLQKFEEAYNESYKIGSPKASQHEALSAEKVYSFALNLLDPNFKFKSGWLPVTVDIWVWTFFYPKFTKAEKEQYMGDNFSYVYLSKWVQKEAKKYGLMPHELQAIIWVSVIRSNQSATYKTTYLQGINDTLKSIERYNEVMQMTGDFYANSIDVIGGTYYGDLPSENR